MKIKIFNIFICLILVGFITGCSSNKENKKVKLSDDFTIETMESKIINNDNLTKYYSINDVDIYLSCISKIYLKDENTEVELKDYLSSSNDQFEEKIDKILSKLTLDEVFYDGGTKVYVDNKDDKKTNNGITIVRCHTLLGDNDIYIGPENSNLENNCN